MITPVTESGSALATGGTAIANVAANDTVNGVAASLGSNATVVTSGTWPSGITLNTTTGAVVVASGTTPGVYSVAYVLCDKASTPNCATAMTDTVTVTAVISPVTDSGTVAATGGTAIANVASNDLVNGAAATLGGSGNATVATSGTWPSSITLNTSTGAVVVASGTTPGVYNVAYVLCDKASTPNCATAMTDTVTVTASACTGTLVVSVPSHVSCAQPAPTVTLPLECRANSNGSRLVGFRFAYVNPVGAASTPHVPKAGLAAPTSTALTTGSDTTFSLTFINGMAPLPYFIYDDAGSLTLTANYTGSGADAGVSLTGTSAAFVVAPASFQFSGIPAAPLTAGQAFNATVTAMNGCASPAATPNFINQTVAITSSNPLPGPGNATQINTNLSGFSGGSASASLTWNEVGTITLNANLASYLGSVLVSGTQAAVGRFHPAYFDTVVTPGCGTFTYGGSTTPVKAGQPFTAKVTANKLGGGVTKNYGDSYAYLTTLSNAGDTIGLANNTITAASFADGVGSANVTYAFATPLTAPATPSLRATDSDTPAVSSSGHTEGTTELRSGRARMLNAYGSELLALPIPVTIEYYDTTPSVGWRTGTDTCTTLSAANFGFSTAPNCASALTICNSVVSVIGSGVKPAVSLTKPGVSTSFCVTLDLGTSLEGNQCIATGETITAATSAGYPWLQYPWTGSAAANPRARATFGIYKSPLIYRRENY